VRARLARRRWVAAWTAAAGLAGAASAWAQIAPLGPPGPSAVTSMTPDVVLRRADWLVYGPLDVEDLLRSVAGVTLVHDGGTGSLQFLGLLGSQSGRVQVVLDGLDVTDVEAAMPRVLAIPLGAIDRIEIFRTTEPARIAFWSRESDAAEPAVDVDLTRGDFGGRTRRVQFFTPPRLVTLGLSYDEVLNEDQDFRADRTTEPPLGLGAADQRSLAVRVDLQRDQDRVRLSHWRTNTNAHGTLFDTADRLPAQAVRTGLRWERPGTHLQSVVEVAHQAWDEPRVLDAAARGLRSARTIAALDLGTVTAGPWSAWLRARGDETSADGVALDGTRLHRRVRAEHAELAIGRTGTLRLAAAGGAHHDPRAGAMWSASGSAGVGGERWSLVARGGRGVQFAGVAPADSVPRRGDHLVLELVRRTPTLDVKVQGFAKRFQDRFAAGFDAWRLGGRGLQRAVGAALDAGWTRAGNRWIGGAQTSVTVVPYQTGDPGGLPEWQGRLQARAGVRLFADDLIVQLTTGWAVDSERRYGDGPSLGSTAIGGGLVDAQVMQRLHVFLGAQNLAGAEVLDIPGVRRPERNVFAGFRVRVLD